MLRKRISQSARLALLSYIAVTITGCTYHYQAQPSDATIVFGGQNKDGSKPSRNFFINLDPNNDPECKGFKRIGIAVSDDILSYSHSKTLKVPALTTIGLKAWALESSTPGWIGGARECSAPAVLFTPDTNSKYSVDMKFDRSSKYSCQISIQKIADNGTRTPIENLPTLPSCGNGSNFHL